MVFFEPEHLRDLLAKQYSREGNPESSVGQITWVHIRFTGWETLDKLINLSVP